MKFTLASFIYQITKKQLFFLFKCRYRSSQKTANPRPTPAKSLPTDPALNRDKSFRENRRPSSSTQPRPEKLPSTSRFRRTAKTSQGNRRSSRKAPEFTTSLMFHHQLVILMTLVLISVLLKSMIIII
jgi:hypothetical protein